MDMVFLESKELEGNTIGDKQDIVGGRPIQTLKPRNKKFKFYYIKYLHDLKVMGGVQSYCFNAILLRVTSFIFGEIMVCVV
jgi:hypothetical protein